MYGIEYLPPPPPPVTFYVYLFISPHNQDSAFSTTRPADPCDVCGAYDGGGGAGSGGGGSPNPGALVRAGNKVTRPTWHKFLRHSPGVQVRTVSKLRLATVFNTCLHRSSGLSGFGHVFASRLTPC